MKDSKFETRQASPIETMTFEDYAEVDHEHPYVFEIEEGGKKLDYFGASHSHDPNDPMFKDLEERMKTAQPQIVLVEGIQNLSELIKGREEDVIDKLKNVSKEELITERGESWFALKVATEIGAKFDSPEPPYEDQINNLLDKELDRESIFAYFMYRGLQEDKIKDFDNLGGKEKYFAHKIEEFKRSSNWDNFDYSLANLEAIGKKIWGEKGDIMNPEFAGERTDPTPWEGNKDNQTLVNEVARQANYFRDKYMVQKIKEALKDNDRIFIVFGASHAVMQEGALRTAMKETT